MINPYSAGSKVYRGGSSAAQSGTLDPTGYINRESNKRSGLAAGPLNSIRGQTGPTTNTTGSVGNFSNRNSLGNILPVSDWDWEKNAPTRPEITVPEGLPPDSAYNQTAVGAINDFQNTARELLWNRQAAEQQYIRNTRDINEQLNPAQMQMRDRGAAAGMGRSSVYSNAVQNMMQQFANQAQDVLAERRLADLAYNTGLTDTRSNYDQIMATAAQALSERLAANAGKLGLGTPDDRDRYLNESEWMKQINAIVKESQAKAASYAAGK